MDHPYFIVCSFMEDSINLKRGNLFIQLSFLFISSGDNIWEDFEDCGVGFPDIVPSLADSPPNKVKIPFGMAILKTILSHDMRFPTMSYVRPAKPQTDQSLC